jgi:MFS family permease
LQQRRFFPVLVLFAINILNFYDRFAPGALTEPMRKEFGLSDTQIGLLGGVFIWIYALAGVPLGRSADTWSRKKLLAIGVIVWTTLTASAGLAVNFNMLLLSRMGVGVGEAVCAPSAASWLGDLFPPERRARALALFMLGVPVGGALSFFFSGPVAQAFGWRAAMVVAAVPAVLLLPALLMLREPQRGASEGGSLSLNPGAEKTSLRHLLSIPTLWWIIASGALLNFIMYAIGSFLPAFLSRVHHLSLASSGIATGAAYLAGGLCGGLLAGYLGDRIVSLRTNGRMLMAAGLAAFGAPFSYLGIVQPAGAMLLALLCLTISYGALNTYYGLVYSSIQDVVAPTQRGFAMAIYFMAMYLCGGSFGPLLTGSLSDHLAKQAMAAAGAAKLTEAFKAAGLHQAMLIVPVLSLLLAAVLYFGSRTISDDMRKRRPALAGAAQTAV